MSSLHETSSNVTPIDGGATALTAAGIEAFVLDTLVELTRYPREILTPDADLDADLGIDSLKRFEIVDALLSRLGREVPDDPSALGAPRTVGELVAVAVREAAAARSGDGAMPTPTPPGTDRSVELGRSTAAPAPAVVSSPSPSVSPGPARTHAEIENIVVDTIAEATRYPRDILLPDARFDEDLGIDSLKRIDIISSLLDRLGHSQIDIQTLGTLPQTIRELTTLTATHLNAASSGVAQRPAPESRAPAVNSAALSARAPANSNESAIVRQPRTVAGLGAGHVVLVEESASGEGAMIARRLTEQGAHVIAVPAAGRHDGATNGRLPLSGSPALGKDIERAVAEIETRFGRLDCFVCIVTEEPETGFEESLWRYYRGATRAARLMRQHGGRIIALRLSPAPGGPREALQGSKRAAFEHLTKQLAGELAAANVSVNAVCLVGDGALDRDTQRTLAEDAVEMVLHLLTSASSLNASILRL